MSAEYRMGKECYIRGTVASNFENALVHFRRAKTLPKTNDKVENAIGLLEMWSLWTLYEQATSKPDLESQVCSLQTAYHKAIGFFRDTNPSFPSSRDEQTLHGKITEFLKHKCKDSSPPMAEPVRVDNQTSPLSPPTTLPSGPPGAQQQRQPPDVKKTEPNANETLHHRLSISLSFGGGIIMPRGVAHPQSDILVRPYNSQQDPQKTCADGSCVYAGVITQLVGTAVVSPAVAVNFNAVPVDVGARGYFGWNAQGSGFALGGITAGWSPLERLRIGASAYGGLSSQRVTLPEQQNQLFSHQHGALIAEQPVTLVWHSGGVGVAADLGLVLFHVKNVPVRVVATFGALWALDDSSRQFMVSAGMGGTYDITLPR